jgi:hypothetical protein
VQLLELIVAVDVVVVGGGTLTFNIGKLAGNGRSITAGTVVKAAVLTGVSAVGLYRADLSDIPYRPQEPAPARRAAEQPLAASRMDQRGHRHHGHVRVKLRYKVYQVGKDT